MNDILVTLNEVQTHLITWADPFNCNGSDVIVCISGNPGISDFYREFGSILHELTKIPVCAIGQAGHEEVPDKQSNVLKGQEHLFDLEGQIVHKLDLITNHIDNRSKLHLIGHSIGSWLILECLQKKKSLITRIASVHLLFPTVQKMADSKNGKFLNNVIRRIHPILIIFFIILDWFPHAVKIILANFYIKINSIPLHFQESVIKFGSSKVLEKVLFMAYNEMDRVRALNNEIIEQIKDRTNVIYSSNDGWVPVSYMEDFRQFEPALKMRAVDIDHAFVLKSSERVAELVTDFIKSKTIK